MATSVSQAFGTRRIEAAVPRESATIGSPLTGSRRRSVGRAVIAVHWPLALRRRCRARVRRGVRHAARRTRDLSLLRGCGRCLRWRRARAARSVRNVARARRLGSDFLHDRVQRSIAAGRCCGRWRRQGARCIGRLDRRPRSALPGLVGLNLTHDRIESVLRGGRRRRPIRGCRARWDALCRWRKALLRGNVIRGGRPRVCETGWLCRSGRRSGKSRQRHTKAARWRSGYVGGVGRDRAGVGGSQAGAEVGRTHAPTLPVAGRMLNHRRENATLSIVTLRGE